MNKKYKVFLVAFLLFFIVNKIYALDSGPVIANNVLGGAASGAVIGLSTGILILALNDKNDDYKLLLRGSIYGLIGGTITGTGIGMYEISTEKEETGFTTSTYVLGGSGIGALLGTVVAILPYLNDGKGKNFSIGMGVGSLVGASVGLGLAIVEINSNPSDTGKLLSGISGQVGVMPELNIIDEEVCLNVQMVKLHFN